MAFDPLKNFYFIKKTNVITLGYKHFLERFSCITLQNLVINFQLSAIYSHFVCKSDHEQTAL